MAVRKKVLESHGKDLKMRLSSKLNQVREAIGFLTDDEGEIQMAAKKVKSTKSTKSEKSNGNANQISLAEICKGLKIEPRMARRILRNKEISVEGGRWAWPKGSGAATKVTNLLKEATAK